MPKIIGGSLTEHREQTRARLFDSLSALLRERPFDAITLAEIAAGAGVGRTAVYNHVPDKETLLLELITHETQSWVVDLEAALEGVDDPVEQLLVYVRRNAEINRSFHLPVGPELRTMLSPDKQQRLREHVVPVAAILRRILEAGVRSGAFVEQPLEIAVPLVHACVSARTAPAEDGPRRAAALAATEAFVLRALGARAPANDGDLAG